MKNQKVHFKWVDLPSHFIYKSIIICFFNTIHDINKITDTIPSTLHDNIKITNKKVWNLQSQIMQQYTTRNPSQYSSSLKQHAHSHFYSCITYHVHNVSHQTQVCIHIYTRWPGRCKFHCSGKDLIYNH